MVQFLSINFFLGFLQFLLGFSKVPVFCVTLYMPKQDQLHVYSLKCTKSCVSSVFKCPVVFFTALIKVSRERYITTHCVAASI